MSPQVNTTTPTQRRASLARKVTAPEDLDEYNQRMASGRMNLTDKGTPDLRPPTPEERQDGPNTVEKKKKGIKNLFSRSKK
jgi:hypothetical protein